MDVNITSESNMKNSIKNNKKEINIKNELLISKDNETCDNKFTMYENLSDDEKIILKMYSIMKIRKHSIKCMFEKVLFVFKNFFGILNNKKYEGQEKYFKTFIYEIGDYLKIYAPKTFSIFRKSVDKVYFTKYPLRIANGKIYDIECVNIYENGCIFKGYIRDILMGLIPKEIGSKLIKILKNTDLGMIKILDKIKR